MLDLGLKGLLSLKVKGPLSVVLIEERRTFMSWISWGEIPCSVDLELEDSEDLELEGVGADPELVDLDESKEEVSLEVSAREVSDLDFSFSEDDGVEVPIGDPVLRVCSSFFISDFASLLSLIFLDKDLPSETIFPRVLPSYAFLSSPFTVDLVSKVFGLESAFAASGDLVSVGSSFGFSLSSKDPKNPLFPSFLGISDLDSSPPLDSSFLPSSFL